MSKQFILASASLRRIEMLTRYGYDFEVIPAEIEEVINNELEIEFAIEELAYLKANSVFLTHDDSVVLAADTVVVCDNQILGKPLDAKDAKDMLMMLSGKKHRVITGVCVLSNEKTIVDHEVTYVTFHDLSDIEIEEYLQHDEAFDKAGSYAIQGIASKFVSKVEGDYDNVVGLPLSKVTQLLEKQGIRVAK